MRSPCFPTCPCHAFLASTVAETVRCFLKLERREDVHLAALCHLRETYPIGSAHCHPFGGRLFFLLPSKKSRLFFLLRKSRLCVRRQRIPSLRGS